MQRLPARAPDLRRVVPPKRRANDPIRPTNGRTDRRSDYCGTQNVAAAGAELDPYLRRYLPGYIGAAGVLDRLGQRIDVLDRLDADAVAAEAMRTSFGHAVPLLPPVLTTMVAHHQLHSPSAEQRCLTRALAAARLGLDDPRLKDPRLRWSHLQRVVPHLPLTGHAAAVSGPVGSAPCATGGCCWPAAALPCKCRCCRP